MILVDIHKQLQGGGGTLQLRLEFSVAAGELLLIGGPSGSGKTSLLRMLAGLLKPDGGRIVCEGKTWYSNREQLRPGERNIAFVFQDYGLFPNMSIAENLAFAATTPASAGETEELLFALDLEGLKNRRPAQLSGGQRQRAAIARALHQRPRLLLLDEAFSALDPDLKPRVQHYLLQRHQRDGLTTLAVTHDVYGSLQMADRVLLLKDGKADFVGTPTELLYRNTPREGTTLRLPVVGSTTTEVTIQLQDQLLKLPALKAYRVGEWIEVRVGADGLRLR